MKIVGSYFLLLSLLIFNLFACKVSNENTNEIDNSFNEVMDLHDEVMPKMSDLHDLKNQIEDLFESEEALQESSEATALITALEETDEKMMQWMADFNKPDKEMAVEEALNYLNRQKMRMEAIKVETEDVIYKAQQWIEHEKS